MQKMTRYLNFFIAAFLFAACASFSESSSLEGRYVKSGDDFSRNLTLNKDSTFVLTIQDLEVTKKCKGSWQHISQDIVLLVCENEEVHNQLSSGYMKERRVELKILQKNKLKLNNITLTKVE